MDMNKTVRGRPRLNLQMSDLLEEIRLHGNVVAAARHLGCSPAYIHARLKEVGITLGELLDSTGPADTPPVKRE